MVNTSQPQTGEFRHGFFDCCGNCGDCLFAYFLPECYGFAVANAAGKDVCFSVMNCLCYPLCLCCLRGSVRSERGIEGNVCTDLLVSLCCPCCTAIQIKREFTD